MFSSCDLSVLFIVSEKIRNPPPLTRQWRIYIVKFWTPPKGPDSFNFMQFLGKIGKSYVGAPSPHLKGWRPNLREILDPPMQGLAISRDEQYTNTSTIAFPQRNLQESTIRCRHRILRSMEIFYPLSMKLVLSVCLSVQRAMGSHVSPSPMMYWASP